jgi:hypothetical protein
MKKPKKKPLALIVAQSADLRVVQTGPGRFDIETRRTDRIGGDKWIPKEIDTYDYHGDPRPGLDGLVDLLRAVPGHSDLRAPWETWLDSILGAALCFSVGLLLGVWFS